MCVAAALQRRCVDGILRHDVAAGKRVLRRIRYARSFRCSLECLAPDAQLRWFGA